MSDELKMLRETAYQFSQNEILPLADKTDKENSLPIEL